MNILNLIKAFNAIPPGVIKDNAAYVANVIDRNDFCPQGAKGVLFIVQLGVTDKALAALIVKQSDTKTDGVTLGGTPTTVYDVVTKPTATQDGGLFFYYIPAHKWTERYLQLQATAGNGTAGTYLNALAIADHEGDGAITADALGITALEIA